MSVIDSETRKTMIRNTFDTVCEGYDSPALRFFHNAAAHLPEMFSLSGDESILDVATGTGTPALALAPRVPRGRITAVDFSAGMLSQGRDKAGKLGIGNIEFLDMDMTDLRVPDGSFDAANCSFGVFFTEDMVATVRHIVSKLKAGATMVTCHFREGSMVPLNQLFLDRVQAYGVDVPPIGWRRVGSEQANRELFAAAGLDQVRVEHRSVGYFLDHPERWWDVVWWAGYRGLLDNFDSATLQRFKTEHLAEVTATAEAEGIPMPVDVMYTVGVKPMQ